MRLGRRIGVALICGWAATAVPARGVDLWGRFDLLGQTRDGYQTRDTQSPVDLYGNVGVNRLWHSSRAETFFRLEQDLATGDNAGDFYAGYAQVPNALPGVEATVGRQFLSEGPGGVFVADAGKVRIDQGWPVAFTLYGGAPQYFEPTYSAPIISQDEVIWGGNMRTTRWRGGQLTLGYQQWERDSKVLRQLVSTTAVQTFSSLPGLPKVYGTLAYDADRQNIDTANVGVDFFFRQPLLLFNLASTYYQPQDDTSVRYDLDRQEDTTFQLFSDSELVQVRTGVRHPFSRALSVYGDFSYQTYDNAVRSRQNGYIAHAGVLWLPEGDGLETVQLAYYLADSHDGGNVNGASLFYENHVYERLSFRIGGDVAYYEKENNQSDWPIHTLTAIGYDLAPGLMGQLMFEANRNAFFDSDLRFGFQLTYNFRRRIPTAIDAGAHS